MNNTIEAQVIRLLPDDVPLPELGLDYDKRITLDWRNSNGMLVFRFIVVDIGRLICKWQYMGHFKFTELDFNGKLPDQLLTDLRAAHT